MQTNLLAMISIQDLYEYRVVASRCEAGLELSLDDIEFLSERETTAMKPSAKQVFLGGNRIWDWVPVVELSYRNLVAAKCPWMEVGDIVDITFEDIEAQTSFLFKARVTEAEDSEGDLLVTFQLVGSPIRARHLIGMPALDTTVQPIFAS